MFIAALLAIARTGEQAKCLLVEERIDKRWCINARGYHSAVRRDETETRVESSSCCDVMGTLGILSQLSRIRYLHLQLRGGNGALLDVGWTSCFLSSGYGYVGELLELRQGCE